MTYKICAIVVTYNRKHLLLDVLDALVTQTYPLSSILIIDNASTDGTYEYLVSTGYVQRDCNVELDKIKTCECKHKINLMYYRTSKNGGGSGGFHIGLKEAFELKAFDHYWMMDDDGYPSKCCLENLILNVHLSDYIMPVSIDIDNHKNLSWPSRMKNGVKTINYQELKESWGDVMDYIFPFNGSLLSNELVKSVGYVDKRLFIWGDEYDHYWRCRQKGYNPLTITNSKFYHPANKMEFVPICFGLFKVPYVDSELKMICLARNYTYIHMKYDGKIKIIVKFIMYSWLYLITRSFDIRGYKLYVTSVLDGLRQDFTRHLKYLK